MQAKYPFHMNSLKCSVSSGECCSIVLFHSAYRPALGAESVIYITSISSVVGAWLGAVPIPLDWDRPWQVQDQFCAFMCVCDDIPDCVSLQLCCSIVSCVCWCGQRTVWMCKCVHVCVSQFILDSVSLQLCCSTVCRCGQ